MILGVDPGSEETGYALVATDYAVLDAGKAPNEEFLGRLRTMAGEGGLEHAAIESIQSFGMPVGRHVFETCYMIGRALQILADADVPSTLYPRQEYARAICGSIKISDSIIRQALLLRFGGDRKGEPLHLLRGATDKRSAFAVAAYHLDKNNLAERS